MRTLMVKLGFLTGEFFLSKFYTPFYIFIACIFSAFKFDHYSMCYFGFKSNWLLFSNETGKHQLISVIYESVLNRNPTIQNQFNYFCFNLYWVEMPITVNHWFTFCFSWGSALILIPSHLLMIILLISLM